MAIQSLILDTAEMSSVGWSKLLCGLTFASLSLILLIRPVFQRVSPDSKAPEFIDIGQGTLNAWRFFSKRWDFYLEGTLNKARNFSFWVGRYPIVAISGQDARNAFFHSKSLSVNEGYSLMMGVMPAAKITNKEGEDVSEKEGYAPILRRAMLHMLTPEKMKSYLPAMFDVMEDGFEHLKSLDQPTNPFDDIYRMGFKLSMLVFGCAEVTRDAKELSEFQKIYERIKYTFHSTMIVYPWMPTPNNVRKYLLLLRLWLKTSRMVKRRDRTGHRENDACQVMLDKGDPINNIIGIIISLLFAGAQQLGATQAWVLIYMGLDSKWQTRGREEVISVANKYFPNSDMPLQQKLRQLPLEAWEKDFQFLDNCFRESMRLANTALTCFRRNMSTAPVPLDATGQEVVPSGWYACYPMAELHLNEKIYPDPKTFDPTRYDNNEAAIACNLGFGAGRHVCMGKKFAKIEQVTTCAMFLATFEWDLVDTKGRLVQEAPSRDWQRFDESTPLQPVFLRLQGLEKDWVSQ